MCDGKIHTTLDCNSSSVIETALVGADSKPPNELIHSISTVISNHSKKPDEKSEKLLQEVNPTLIEVSLVVSQICDKREKQIFNATIFELSSVIVMEPSTLIFNDFLKGKLIQ